MIWIAPSEKDTAAATVEQRLWDAANQFRATSGLKSQENSAPVLGLPRTDNANATRASAKSKLPKSDRRSVGESELHYLWIQLFPSALNEKGLDGFVMANRTKGAHSCSMKISEEVRRYAVEQGIAEEWVME